MTLNWLMCPVSHFRTLRLRHDLQFIDSRGSLLKRRAGNLSMPTCGRDIGIGWTAGGNATPVVSKGTVMPKVMNGIRQIVDGKCRLSDIRRD